MFQLLPSGTCPPCSFLMSLHRASTRGSTMAQKLSFPSNLTLVYPELFLHQTSILQIQIRISLKVMSTLCPHSQNVACSLCFPHLVQRVGRLGASDFFFCTDRRTTFCFGTIHLYFPILNLCTERRRILNQCVHFFPWLFDGEASAADIAGLGPRP